MTMEKAQSKAVKFFEKIKGFLKETRAELKKVVWPDRKYVTMATIIICIIVIVMGLFVMGVDFCFAGMMTYLEKTF
ncbi:MAG: preprotein translocase subunit SecE [Candidatus Saganbacteria bacterium]|nr:preprotein translocase subunit SecE [Candidatus Saganbacteria bacterium]